MASGNFVLASSMEGSRIIILSLAVCLVFFALIVVFVGEGFVRQVPIFWNEEIHAVVAFRSSGAQLHVVGIVGNGGTDPTLVMKTGNTPYMLTVINQDKVPHMFYVSGLETHTRVLQPGENETITLFSKTEGTFDYYDGLHPEIKIGKIIAAKVEATD